MSPYRTAPSIPTPTKRRKRYLLRLLVAFKVWQQGKLTRLNCIRCEKHIRRERRDDRTLYLFENWGVCSDWPKCND